MTQQLAGYVLARCPGRQCRKAQPVMSLTVTVDTYSVVLLLFCNGLKVIKHPRSMLCVSRCLIASCGGRMLASRSLLPFRAPTQQLSLCLTPTLLLLSCYLPLASASTQLCSEQPSIPHGSAIRVCLCLCQVLLSPVHVWPRARASVM